jgi:hypothetical protein
MGIVARGVGLVSVPHGRGTGAQRPHLRGATPRDRPQGSPRGWACPAQRRPQTLRTRPGPLGPGRPGRGVSPWGADTALGHDESPTGPSEEASGLGARPGRGGRGLRPRGPWPPCGQGVRALPVRGRLHAPALGGSGGGGAVGGPRRWRHWRQARAFHRWARPPTGRRRWQPWGTIGSRKRRSTAWAARVMGCP